MTYPGQRWWACYVLLQMESSLKRILMDLERIRLKKGLAILTITFELGRQESNLEHATIP